MASGQWVSSASFPAQRLVESKNDGLTPSLPPFSLTSALFASVFPLVGKSTSIREKLPSLSARGPAGLRRIKAAEVTLARLQQLQPNTREHQQSLDKHLVSSRVQ